MILKVNSNGIKDIRNTHTKAKRDMISIGKFLELSGPISIKIDDMVLNLGYNETIYFDNEEDLIKIFEKIDEILS